MNLNRTPHALVVCRLLCGPLMVLVAILGRAPLAWACFALLTLGALADLLGPEAARRWGANAADLPRVEGRGDLIFWASAAVAAHILHPSILSFTWPMLVAVAVLQLSTQIVALARFHREAINHHYTARFFGLLLWLLLSQLMLTGTITVLLPLAFAVGLVSGLEGLAIVSTMPAWNAEVVSFPAARELRRAARSRSGS